MTAPRDTRVGFCAALVNGPKDQRSIVRAVTDLPGSELFVGEDMFSRRGKSLSGALLLDELLKDCHPKSEASALAKQLLQDLVDKEFPQSYLQAKLNPGSIELQHQEPEETQTSMEASPSESQVPTSPQEVIGTSFAEPPSPSEMSKKSSTSKRSRRSKRKLENGQPDRSTEIIRAVDRVIVRGCSVGVGRQSALYRHSAFECQKQDMSPELAESADHLLSVASAYIDKGFSTEFSSFEYGFEPEECSVCKWALECKSRDEINWDSSAEERGKVQQRHNAADTLAVICHVAAKHGILLPRLLNKGGIKFGVGLWDQSAVEDGIMCSLGKA